MGLRAATFALTRRGHTVWMVPTVVMPWHPGHGASTRTPMPQLAAQLEEMAANAAGVDAVLTGYFADAAQVKAAAAFIDAVKAARPDAVVVVDPVTGDENGRYVPDAVAEAIRDCLLPRADVATPNVNELRDLGGAATPEAAAGLAPAVVVTSAVLSADEIEGWVVRGADVVRLSHPRVASAARGTGDLYSAVLTAALLEGGSVVDAAHTAAAATLSAVHRSGSEALDLAASQNAIAAPDLATVHRDGTTGRRVHGVDGCPRGWAVVSVAAEGPLLPEASLVPTLAPLVASGEIVAVDMPIGLPDRIVGPGRGAEQAVRPLLRGRQSSVFSIPARAAVYAPDYASACEAALATSEPPRKISKQSFMIFPKIKEIDELLTPLNEERVFEVHPEMAFWHLNGGEAMATAKTVKGMPARQGLESRIALLVREGFAPAFFEAPPAGVPLVDLVDAAASALIARRCAAGTARPYPDPPERDARGLRAAIWV
ncbi:PfkB family carbohydrate kinase [Acuticoccus sp. MNP-M23]|uniref:PfkB family carbohydrate kinase n=1 Tax=Acuticoccus sp. MNP-M23 TaxID=3072793 RepID=UPI00281655D1|nr:PfkB family carbohydrate kinase [Acuticoccus sp. MNP-M23]WMS44092.1 PfkB family carbohydrate kinase [Acuticoccus sp. MNP-M23]